MMLDALAPVLSGELLPPSTPTWSSKSPVRSRLQRVCADPIIVGGAESGMPLQIKAARARDSLAELSHTARGRPRPWRRTRRHDSGRRVDAQHARRQNAPKGPAALSKQVPFAFASGGLTDLSLFIRNAARTVKEGSLPADAALAALTSEAAKMRASTTASAHFKGRSRTCS
jgi:hypothetical protein